MTDPIRKSFSVISKAIDAEQGIFEAMITTEATDRGGDIVRASGAKLDNYLKNAVVMWVHDYSQPPIGKTLSIEIIPGTGLKAQWQFSEWGINPQADITRRLWSAGFLNATSIGFIPIKSTNLDGTNSWGPQEYVEWELLEFSIVPIPANQDALRLAIKQLSGVLPANQGEADTQSTPEGVTNTDPTSNDANKAELDNIFTLINLLAPNVKEIFHVRKI
jgi:HK97 family phage prohead protease